MKKENYIIRLFRGDISLKITFWIWFIIINIVLSKSIEFLFNKQTIKELNISSYLVIIISIIYSLYLLFVFIAIWRSSTKYNGPKLWSILSKIVVIANSIHFGHTFYEKSLLHFNDEKRIKFEINDLNSNLPYKISRDIIFTKASIKDKNIFYTYKLNNFKPSKLHGINRQLFEDDITKRLCNDIESKNLIYKNYNFVLNYKNNSNSLFTTVTVSKDNCDSININQKILKEILSKSTNY